MVDYYDRYSTFEGPSEEERTEALRQHRRQGGILPSLGQGNTAPFIGTPRKGKHKGGHINGVRFK